MRTMPRLREAIGQILKAISCSEDIPVNYQDGWLFPGVLASDEGLGICADRPNKVLLQLDGGLLKARGLLGAFLEVTIQTLRLTLISAGDITCYHCPSSVQINSKAPYQWEG